MARKQRKYPEMIPLWMALFSDIIGFSILITVYPSIALEFNLNPLEAGLIMAVNGLFSFFSAPLWGKLSDKHGRKPMLLLSQFGTFLGFIILAFSPNFTWVIISRVIDGMFGGNYPIAKAIINDIVKPKDLPEQMTTIGVAHNVANLFGPALGGILFVNFGLIAPGLAAALISLFTLIITQVKLKESAPIKVNPEMLKIKIPDNSSSKSLDISSKKQPKWYSNKPLVTSLLILAFSSFGFMTLISNFAMFAFLKLDMDSQSMGIFLTVSAVFQILIRYTVYMPALRKIGVMNMVTLGFVLYLVEFIILGIVVTPTQFILIMILSTIATSATRGGINSFIGTFARPHERGKVQGFATSLDTFAQIIGPILGGALLTYLPLEFFGSASFIFMAISLIILQSARTMKKALKEKIKESEKSKDKSLPQAHMKIRT
ncbi:MFS transporter [Promethearchaeum syntrophicum]|uniref:MFS transporter n=1 Tax=Promethearchaeum syntrophicum TaxID=2594042 RepID=A0A5B9DE03_9ARCH|nr:MFS transporter [Candidatus Prometheoarchaeum syntrophicum]QEE17107.1 drug efflux system protein MdtG [Candidatus Prometheoarchaeum syntrophicum]